MNLGSDLHNLALILEAVTTMLAAICLTAGYLPARCAANTDPMQALRHE